MIAILIIPFLALCVIAERRLMFELPKRKINDRITMNGFRRDFNLPIED